MQVTLRGTRCLTLRITVASSFLQRMRGLLGSEAPGRCEGLLIKRCGSVHTLGMRYPIDVAFLDRDMRVLSIHASVLPGRLMLACRGAKHTLELAAGEARRCGLSIGERLTADG